MSWALAVLLALALSFVTGALWLIRKGGRDAERRDQVERAGQVKDRQLDHAAAPPAGRDDLLGRMQRGDL